MHLKRFIFRCFSSLFLIFIFLSGYSQDEAPEKFTTGADFYSRYVFRGTEFGSGPSVQPNLKFTSGIFTAGAWGSFDFNGYQEADLYVSFALPAGFTLGVTDYYYPGLDYFDYTSSSGSHAFEINLGFSWENLNLSANYILNEAGGAGSKGNDLYFEGRYTINPVYFVLGAGNGWHSANNTDGSDRFNVCHLGLGITRQIKITDTFNIPVNGQVIVNPDREQMFIVVGFTL